MLPRSDHILVPVDVSLRNQAALDFAFEMAVENKAKVSLLHVIQAIDDVDESPDEQAQRFYEHVRVRVASEMDRMSQRFLEAGIRTEVKIRIGDCLREIIAFAAEHKVTLIVMSSHRIDPSELTKSWGTLSYKVSVLCECPILLVK